MASAQNIPHGRRGRRPLGRTLAVLGLLLGLAGCLVGPDHQPPKPDLPAGWSELKGPGAEAAGLKAGPFADALAWWRAFDDPRLASLVERAFTANLDLKQAEARIRQARAARGVAAAEPWPSLSAGASAARTRSSGETRTSALSEATSDLYQVGLDASWELDIFGGARRGVEAADADLRAAVEDLGDVRVSLAGEVGVAYLDLRWYQTQRKLARDTLAAQQRTAELTRQRQAAGFVSGLDLASAEAQAASTAAQLPTLEAGVKRSILNLELLLAQPPGSLAAELSAGDTMPPTPLTVPVGLPSELLLRRPDLRKAEASLHAATARVGVATADLYPRFSLTGSVGLGAPEVGSLGNWTARTWSLGGGVTWAVFDAGRIRWNIAAKEALREQEWLAYQKAVLTALKEVESALVSFAQGELHRRAVADWVTSERRTLDLALRQYRAGKTNFLNVLEAQRALYQAETSQAQAVRDQSAQLIALYKALGGGWNPNRE